MTLLTCPARGVEGRCCPLAERGYCRDGRCDRTSSAGTGNESFAVEHRRRDPPAEPVEDQQHRGAAEGDDERGVDHVERDERRHHDRREVREYAELLSDADLAGPCGD